MATTENRMDVSTATVEIVDSELVTAVVQLRQRMVTLQFNLRGLALGLDFEEAKALLQVMKEVGMRINSQADSSKQSWLKA